jgi:hypothetical protein
VTQNLTIIIFNVGTPSLEARNIRLVNIITYIIEESKLISENMSPTIIDGHIEFPCYNIYYFLTNLINDPSSLKLQSRDQNLI